LLANAVLNYTPEKQSQLIILWQILIGLVLVRIRNVGLGCILVVVCSVLCLSSIAVAAAPKQETAKTTGTSVPPPRAPQGLRCATAGACQGAAQNKLAFLLPVFLANSTFRSSAILVNSHSAATYVDVTVHDGTGNVAAKRRVGMAARSQAEIDIGELLSVAQSSATFGSVQIAPATDGTGIGVIGQMSMTYHGSSKPNYLDYEPTRPGPGNSLEQRAVADAGEGSPLVGITSVASSVQNVTIACLGTGTSSFSKKIAIPAGGTVVTQACQDAEEGDLGALSQQNGPVHTPQIPHSALGISLTTDGLPGSFAAYGLIPHKDGGGTFFTAMPFSDPKGAKTSTTAFGGLPVGLATLLPGGNYIPELSVANFST
jgi:hypothetical protein